MLQITAAYANFGENFSKNLAFDNISTQKNSIAKLFLSLTFFQNKVNANDNALILKQKFNFSCCFPLTS